MRRLQSTSRARLFLPAALLLAPLAAHAQTEQKLTASDGSKADRFGVAVAVSGDVAFVGAHWDEGNGAMSGSAYVFVRAGGQWVEAQKLTASDGSTGDLLGEAVAVSGATALVGAPSEGQNGLGSGAAYAYDLSALVAVEPEATPPTLLLHPPAPNPTAGRAAVAIALAQPSTVRLVLYDVLGREVAAVAAGRLEPGPHRLALDVSSLPAGVYVWRLTARAPRRGGSPSPGDRGVVRAYLPGALLRTPWPPASTSPAPSGPSAPSAC